MIDRHRTNAFELRRSPSGACRRGIILFTTIVALLAAGVITLCILRSAVSQYEHIRDQRRQLQADQLAQAAIGRALDRLRSSGEYRGEIWHVSADEVGGPLACDVVIEVQKAGAGADDNQLKISVRADYPPDEIYRIRRSRELLVTLQPREKTP